MKNNREAVIELCIKIANTTNRHSEHMEKLLEELNEDIQYYQLEKFAGNELITKEEYTEEDLPF